MSNSSKDLITPDRQLVEQWIEECRSNDCVGAYPPDYENRIATKAARWGAETELDACCQWLTDCKFEDLAHDLRIERRQSLPALTQLALQMLETIERDGRYLPMITSTIRRALKGASR